jgi:circadian clock protein KaiC
MGCYLKNETENTLIGRYSPPLQNLERIETGIDKLDKLLSGGLPKNSITLISGPPGSGKTIFCYHFLFKGVENNETVLYITLDNKVERVLTQAQNLGFDFQPSLEKDLARFISLNINNQNIYEDFTREITKHSYDRIVIDSINPFTETQLSINNKKNHNNINIISTNEYLIQKNIHLVRSNLYYIINILQETPSTSLLTSELPMGSTNLSRDGISEFLTDGVIILSLDPTMNRRKITIMKMRNTRHILNPKDFEIDNGRIAIRSLQAER